MTDYYDGNTGTRIIRQYGIEGERIAVCGIERNRDTNEWVEVHRATHSTETWAVMAGVTDRSERQIQAWLAFAEQHLDLRPRTLDRIKAIAAKHMEGGNDIA